MRFGYTLPNNLGLRDPQDVVAVAGLCERLGYDSVWVAHHVLNIGYVLDRLGDGDYYDALTILTWAAAHTERIELGTSVLVLPYLHPVNVAKQLATLDRLCRGRLVVGVGVGSLPEENAALGVEYERRGQLTDEFLAVMVALWTETEPQFEGEFFSIGGDGAAPFKASPRPFRSPHPPIVVGGNRPPALRRAARWQGWHPMRLPAASMASRLPTIDAELALRGRSRSGPAPVTEHQPEGFRVHACLDLDLWDAPRDRPPRAPMHGTVDQVVDAIGRYAELGVTDLVLSGMSSDPATLPDAIERFAAEVIPQVR